MYLWSIKERDRFQIWGCQVDFIAQSTRAYISSYYLAFVLCINPHGSTPIFMQMNKSMSLLACLFWFKVGSTFVMVEKKTYATYVSSKVVQISACLSRLAACWVNIVWPTRQANHYTYWSKSAFRACMSSASSHPWFHAFDELVLQDEPQALVTSWPAHWHVWQFDHKIKGSGSWTFILLTVSCEDKGSYILFNRF